MLLILNDVAGSEILLILVFVLIFFGAKSIPGLAKTLGRTIKQVKNASAEIQQEIKKSGSEMKKDLNLKGILEDTANDIKRPLDQYASDIDETLKYQPKVNKPISPQPPLPPEEPQATDDETPVEKEIKGQKEETDE